MNVLPAAVIVPERAAPEFAATLNETVPLAVAEPPLEIVIHAAFETALHAQPVVDVVTAMVPVPPLSAND